ncbi:MAG: hypothetical protein COA95_06210 [Methylophaga sp.]|nr:MAG: hypothetical protein COA95_06210 [Methylophaga sp.]
MKLLYTRENRYLVHNIQNIIENNGVMTSLKNEYAGGGVGDLVPHESWLELWVVNDYDYDKAMQLINDTMKESEKPEWTCSACKEINTAAFEFCWNCQKNHD